MPLIIGTICVFRFAVLGENRDCRQFHAKAPSPLHVDYQGDTILIPTVGTLLEELLRTPDEKIAIERELRRWLGSLQGGEPWNSAALIGIIMERVMNESPLTHRPVILQHTGISTLEEAPTIVLSAESEDARIYKHKSLPLTLAFTNLFRLPADFKRVLDQECVLVPPRPVEEIALSYQHLAHILSARGSRLCVMNNFIHEPGAALLRPAWSTNIKDTYSFRTRSINEALGDLEDKGLLTVLDLDLVKATLGGRRFPDGSHSDRAFDLAAQDLILKAVSAAAT